jgi:hypothetical protein
MIRENSSKALFSASILVAVAVAATPVQAQKPPPPNAPAGSGFPQFTNEADAVRQCGNDRVVWGSGANKGVYYMPGAGPYSGAGPAGPVRIGGFYACAAVVTKAGMKIETGK